MKKLFFMLLVLSVTFYAQNSKVTDLLKAELNSGKAKVAAWVFFTDKGDAAESLLANPELVVSKRSLKRRAKVREGKALIDYSDLPVSKNYISKVLASGAELRNKSRWFNGVSVMLTKAQLDVISTMSFVKKIDIVYAFGKSKDNIEFREAAAPENKTMQPKGVHSYDYGDSYTQLEQINVPAVHDLGITGQGVLVCVMDAGFNNLEHQDFATTNILATWDFVNGDDDVDDGSDMGEGSHGTNTLSTIGGFHDGSHLGPAFGADYILAKTENTESETPVEEDNWIAAAEWADSIGADVSSTSLGYITFDSPYTDYTWADMDGNTCRITIGADLAAGKGMVVVNSAGNEGSSSHNTLGAPSDGDSVLAVGAVGSSGSRVYFSSVGNTVDGRTKPDVMAMGSGVHAASTSSSTGYTYVDGTSFSCPLTAGVAALVLSFNPDLTPVQVYDILRTTANNADAPNREYGWGIVNAYQAIQYATTPDAVAPDQVTDLAVSTISSNSFTATFSAPNDTSTGGVMEYQIRYSTSPINDTLDFLAATPVEYGAPAEPGTTEQFTITGLDFSTQYYVAVRARDFWNNWSDLSNVAVGTTYAAPTLGTNVESFSVVANVGQEVKDTLTLSNAATELSTLDYTVSLENNTFPENSVKVKIKPVALDLDTKEAKGARNTSAGQSLKGFGGPDNFGYEWIDSDADNGPAYEWNDISSTGTAATWTAAGTYDELDEGIAGPYDLGFNYKFYGQEYSQVYFSTNGFITFESFSGSVFSNDAIPDSEAPNALIAAVWDDLDGGDGGTVYYQQFDNKFVVQYDSWPEYSDSGEFTFQIVIFKNGNVMIYYNSVTGDLTGSTVGIEDHNGTDGLQVVNNAAYLSNNKALKFSAEPEWVVPSNYEGTLSMGSSADIELEFITNDIPQGIYSIDLVVNSNDPDNTSRVIPVEMNLGMSNYQSATINVTDGWNLVSTPLEAQNMAADVIMHDAETPIFGFDGAYSTVDMLHNGKGYWVKYSGTHQMEISGLPPSNNVEVAAGWNLIGPYNETVQISSITTVPAGIIESDFFKYENSYQVYNYLTPGCGYWVKASQAGELVFGTDSKSAKSNITEYADQITFIDAAGKMAVLYVADNDVNADMPPLPPAGSFDIRFADNTYAGTMTEAKAVKLQGLSLPVKVTAANGEYLLSFAGAQVKIAKNSEAVISENISDLTINSVVVPTEFSLEQNYPNPFNPSTTIKFALPVEAKVTVTLYNALGQRVNEIVSNNFTAGVQTVNFNASELASGMYIYQISAQGVDGSNFVDTKKMILMK